MGNTLATALGALGRFVEACRRFLLHVLPKGFYRIRHYGLLASSRTKAETLARARELIAAATPPTPVCQAPAQQPANDSAAKAEQPAHPCPCCGAAMMIIETFEAGQTPRYQPTAVPIAIRVDTS